MPYSLEIEAKTELETLILAQNNISNSFESRSVYKATCKGSVAIYKRALSSEVEFLRATLLIPKKEIPYLRLYNVSN